MITCEKIKAWAREQADRFFALAREHGEYPIGVIGAVWTMSLAWNAKTDTFMITAYPRARDEAIGKPSSLGMPEKIVAISGTEDKIRASMQYFLPVKSHHRTSHQIKLIYGI